jgi:hypothetical protein
MGGDFEKAQASIKVLTRRIKTENNSEYNHILYLLKSFDLEINKDPSPKNSIKKRDLFMLFTANNLKNSNFSVIPYLMSDLKAKYQI